MAGEPLYFLSKKLYIACRTNKTMFGASAVHMGQRKNTDFVTSSKQSLVHVLEVIKY